MLSLELNPWNASSDYNYSKLIKDFGISLFNELLPNIKNPNLYMKRNIIFGHRNFEKIIYDINHKLNFVVVDGFMPTGPAHFGHKLVMDQILWFQKHGGTVFISIADLEAYSVRNIPYKKCYDIGINEYILNLIALGLKPENTYFYFQSKCKNLQKLSFEFGNHVGFGELSSIYGFSELTSLSHLYSTINQVSDILLPQTKDFFSYTDVVVPVGADQDPHIRLTRDIVNKVNMFYIEKRYNKNLNVNYWSIRRKNAPEHIFIELKNELYNQNFNIKESRMHIDIYEDVEYKILTSLLTKIANSNGYYHFNEPSSTYHKFMSGLNGSKMSSSIPESHISLNENYDSLNKKIKHAKTGGRKTISDHKTFGGNPEKCPIYDLFLYHIYLDDKEIQDLYTECTNGKIFCGQCKKIAVEKINLFLKNHIDIKDQSLEKLDLYNFIC